MADPAEHPEVANADTLRALVASTAYAIIATRTDGIITVFNRAAERLLGWSAEEMVDRRTPSAFHLAEEVVERAAELSRELGRTVEPGFDTFVVQARERRNADERPWTYVRKDGTHVPVLLSVTALEDAAGTVTGYLGIARDISALRKAEAALRASEAESRLLALVARETSNGVVITDTAGLVTWVNQGFTRMTGWTLDDMRGRRPGSVLQGPDSDPRTIAAIRASVAARRPCTAEVLNYTRDGRALWVQLGIQPLIDDQGRCEGFISISADITSIKQAEAAMRTAKESAEQAARAKGEFLATMSHEIRTPMNGVLGMAQLLAKTSLDPRQREFVDTIRSSGELLLALINDILDLSKLEAGKVELERTALSPRRLVSDVLALLAEQARGKGIALTQEVAPEVPNWLVGDPVRLRQVLLNLVGNAVKFTDRGAVSVMVASTAGPDAGHRLAIAVHDTGIGMTAAQIAGVGQAFTQGDSSTTRRFGGTGLGMSISFRLVHLMGGAITIASEPGRGSTFRLEVPLPAAAAPADQDQPVAPQATRGPAIRLTRVLVAEDNPVNQRLVSLLLAPLVERVDLAPDGATAVALAAAHRYDCMLMDCQMPDMDGYEAARRIRAAEAASGLHPTPIIALTANALSGDRQRCLAAGMDGYLSKPLREEELLATLDRLVDRHDQAWNPQATRARLVAAVGEEVLLEVAQIALATLPGQRDELLAAHDDPVRLAKLAHGLRGTALALGIDALAQRCAELERLAKAADRAGLQAALPAFDAAIARTLVLLGELGAPEAAASP